MSATAADLLGPSNRAAHLRRVPALVVGALRIVWGAARHHLTAMIALQLALAVGISVQLLISRSILEALVSVSHGAPVSATYLPFALLAVLTMVLGAVTAAAAYEQKLLAELPA